MSGETSSPSEVVSECQICHLRTRYPNLLVPVNHNGANGFSETIRVCPACISRKRFRTALFSLLLSLIIAFLVAICLVANRHEPLETMAYFSFSLVFSPAIVILLHELGHAIVGRWVGLEFFGITIGSGPLLFRWHFRGIYFDLHSYPAGGACWTYPSPDRVQRWRLILMVAGGPISTGLLLLAALCIATRGFSIQPRNLHLNGWVGLIWTTAIVFVYSCWPHSFRRDGTKIPNDAKLILNFLKTPPDRESYSLGYIPLKIAKCMNLRQPANVRLWRDQLKNITGDTIGCRIKSFEVMAMEGDWSTLWREAKDAMQTATAEGHRETFAAWAAVALVYDNQDLDEAQSLAEEAMRVWPWDGTTQSIRALVLLAQGCTEESAHILKNLSFDSLSYPAKAGVARMWLEIFDRRGNSNGAPPKWRKRAETFDPFKACEIKAHRSTRFSG